MAYPTGLARSLRALKTGSWRLDFGLILAVDLLQRAFCQDDSAYHRDEQQHTDSLEGQQVLRKEQRADLRWAAETRFGGRALQRLRQAQRGVHLRAEDENRPRGHQQEQIGRASCRE